MILLYSSMPGTSRHHWGTDFDINELKNSYYDKGDGKIVYTWLKQHAHKYGFCQPYTKGRKKGYEEEKWHWSYIPVARILQKDWNRFYRDNSDSFIKDLSFAGSDTSAHLAPIYVNSINRDCM